MEETTPRGRPTIVGGSPMNRLVPASTLPLNIERLLIRAALSRDFKQRFLADRQQATVEAGIVLSPLEQTMLSHVDDETLQATIDRVIIPPISRRGFLKRAAASVVVALTGSALLLQTGCGGIAPDPVVSAYDNPGFYWANLADLRCFVYVPEVYAARREEFRSTPVLLSFPDVGQTSLELAEHWLDCCQKTGIVLIVAEWSGVPTEEAASRTPQILQDANDLWGQLSTSTQILTGFAAGAVLALQAGICADSPFRGVVAYSGLPAPGWETSIVAREETRVYIRLGRQDLNAGQYRTVVEALRDANCVVSAHRKQGQIPLAEQPTKTAWNYVTRD
jgi:hypothetical protein